MIARADDDVTVKTLQRKGAVVELLPATNPDYAPIVADTRREPLVIEGVMVGLIRKDH